MPQIQISAVRKSFKDREKAPLTGTTPLLEGLPKDYNDCFLPL